MLLVVLAAGCGRGRDAPAPGASGGPANGTAAAGGAAPAAPATSSTPAPQDRPAPPPGSRNVLLVTVDTLRADHLGAYRAQRPTSPRLDAFAGQGVRFDREFSPRSLTWPSLTTILTGQPPRVHGVRRNGDRIRPDQETLPGLLARSGWVTAAFRASFHTQPVPGLDADLGSAEPGNWVERDLRVTRGALEWLEKNRDRRFFAWLHYIGPHDPYQPAPPFNTLFTDPAYAGPYDGSAESLTQCIVERRDLSKADLDHIVALYDGEVRATDEQFGLVLDALDRLGLRDSTVVVFTADHGEELYQRNHYFFHGCSVYDSTLHVPLAIRAPGRLPAGLVIGHVTESADLAPTLLELAGGPKASAAQGFSLLPLIEAEAQDAKTRLADVKKVNAEAWPRAAYTATGITLPEDRFLDGERIAISEYRDKILILRTAEWRYVHNPEGLNPTSGPYKIRKDDPGYAIGREELYHTATDPLERVNVAAANPELCARFRAALLKWAASRPNAMQDTAVDEKTKEELKSLGYIQ